MEETNKNVVDDCFKRPMLGPSIGSDTITIPVIDVSLLHDPLLRPSVIHEIGMACKGFGSFQIINHDISSSVMKDALDAATRFFNLPFDDKMHLVSDDCHKPVRYVTSSINHSRDRVQYLKDFIKHYSHPLSKWIDLWPSNPPCYKEKVGKYAEATHVLYEQLIEAISESLGLEKTYLQEETEEGTQLMTVNCYPPACPEPEIAMGAPPHTDFSTLTILLQSRQGLQIMDINNNNNNNWVSVPYIEGALIVQLGDQVEVMSNGTYKSVLHRVTLNKDFKRLSFASLHSLSMHKKISPATELVNENKVAAYGAFSFNDFLVYMSNNDVTQKSYIDTLKK